MSCTCSRERPPSSGKIYHHSSFTAHFKFQYKRITFRIFFLFTTNHQCTVIPKEQTRSIFMRVLWYLVKIKASCLCSFSNCLQFVGTESGRSRVNSVFVSRRSRKNILNRCAFASLIVNTQYSCEHHLAMTSVIRGTCTHVCVLALLRRCNQFCAR